MKVWSCWATNHKAVGQKKKNFEGESKDDNRQDRDQLKISTTKHHDSRNCTKSNT